LKRRGVDLQTRLVPKDGLPDDPGDLLIVMGGPMSVNDADHWITDETSFIRSAMLAGTPTIGVCLGSQFMARALGAAVRPGRGFELGMTPVLLTTDGRRDPVFGGFPDRFDVFEWHGEVFDLPSGAVALAGSELASVQAFRYGERAYGLLFHLEIEETGIDALCRECASDLIRAKVSRTQIIEQSRAHMPRLHGWTDRLVAHLLPSSR
jgi:GMP synthase-like glutamine amidotransferase